MLQVAINQNVKFVGAEINEKGTLAISFIQGKKLSLLERMSQVSDTSTNNKEQAFLEFPYTTTDWQGKQETYDVVFDKIERFKNKLTHILLQFLTTDKITLDPFKGLGITEANIANKLVDENTVAASYKTLTEQFVALVKTIPAKSLENEFRLKLVRTSKKSHFAKIPDYAPFMEPMSVTEESSKVGFTKSEIKNGKNDGTKLEAETVEVSEEEKQAQLAALASTFTFGDEGAEVIE